MLLTSAAALPEALPGSLRVVSYSKVADSLCAVQAARVPTKSEAEMDYVKKLSTRMNGIY